MGRSQYEYVVSENRVFGALVHVRCVDDQLAVLSIGLGPSGTISEANLYPSHKVYRGELDL